MAAGVEKLREKFGVSLDCGCGLPAWEGDYDRFSLQNVKIWFRCKGCSGCVLKHGMLEDNVHLLIRTAYPRR